MDSVSALFNHYASTSRDGELLMTYEDLIAALVHGIDKGYSKVVVCRRALLRPFIKNAIKFLNDQRYTEFKRLQETLKLFDITNDHFMCLDEFRFLLKLLDSKSLMQHQQFV
jgi:hypothetical protein